jgi:hypothetical protein
VWSARVHIVILPIRNHLFYFWDRDLLLPPELPDHDLSDSLASGLNNLRKHVEVVFPSRGFASLPLCVHLSSGLGTLRHTLTALCNK